MVSNFSGDDSVAAETQRVEMVPASTAREKTQEELDWEKSLIREAASRITRRTWLFGFVAAATGALFLVFLTYVLWAHFHPGHKVDHLLLWLLAALPLGLLFILIKLTADPKPNETVTTWPEELIKLGDKVADVVADVVKKKLG